MKTIVLIIFATMLLGFVYLRIVPVKPDEDGDMAKFIPNTALLYVEQRNGSEMLKQFAASRLGQNLESIDYEVVAKEIGVEDDSISAIKNSVDFYKTAKVDPIFNALLGKRLTIAVMEPIDSSSTSDIMQFIRANVIIIVEPEYSAELLEIAGESYGRQRAGMVLDSSQYGAHRIRRFLLDGEYVSLVTIDGFFIISRNENQLRRCIDTFDGEFSSLVNDQNFQEIRKNIGAPDRFLYIPMITIRNFLSSLLDSYSFPSKNLLLQELQATIGFNGFGYGSWRKPSTIEEKVLIRFEKSEINTFARRFVETPQVESSMLSLVTKDPMIYYWSNTLCFKNFLMYIDDGAQHDPRVADFITRLEAAAEKDASETFALLGKEVSMIIEEGPRDDLFPFPLGLFFIQVERTDELKAIIAKLLQPYNLPMKEKEYGPAWYTYWSRSPQDGLLPLYGFWNNLFFFGNSANLLHKVIDTNLSKYALPDSEAVQKIDPGLNRKNNSVTYFNNIHFITMIKNFLEVLGTFVAIEDRDVALKVRAAIKNLVNPLLDGVMMYSASASRSHFTPDMLVIDSITDISDNPKILKE